MARSEFEDDNKSASVFSIVTNAFGDKNRVKAIVSVDSYTSVYALYWRHSLVVVITTIDDNIHYCTTSSFSSCNCSNLLYSLHITNLNMFYSSCYPGLPLSSHESPILEL